KRKPEPESDDDLVNSDLDAMNAPKSRGRAPKVKGRSPSTSPPPAPPSVEYMREGYAADDIWMMVEDEFHSTAQAFTQHIHHAEYVRLKKLAKSRGQNTIQAIKRPTDGRTAQCTATKLRLEAEQKAIQQRNGLKSMGVAARDESEEEDEYMYDANLAGLMTGSQRQTQDLTRLTKARSNTRAAAGYTKSPKKPRTVRVKTGPSNASTSRTERPISDHEESQDEEDDDLDGPSQTRSAATSKIPASRGPQGSRSERATLAEKAAKASTASRYTTCKMVAAP
ncbi:hypothetical protein LTR53_018083, partial [Teratosphaeriaceae sp. CCFEE 6253]